MSQETGTAKSDAQKFAEEIDFVERKLIDNALQCARLRCFGSYFENGLIVRPPESEINQLTCRFESELEINSQRLLELLSDLWASAKTEE